MGCFEDIEGGYLNAPPPQQGIRPYTKHGSIMWDDSFGVMSLEVARKPREVGPDVVGDAGLVFHCPLPV